MNKMELIEAVAKALDDGDTISLGAQRRVDLVHRVEGGATLVCEGEVVRGRFCCDPQACRSGSRHHRHRACSGEMLEVHPRTCHAGKGYVAHHH